MTEQAGHGNGQDATPGRDPDLPDGIPGAPGRDSCLPGFAAGGEWDACPPSASLALALESASGPEWRCPGASREEMFGLLRQWQALESRAVAGKLGILRALIREDDQPLPGGGYHGDLPEGWTKSLTHEVAAALSMPVVSADRLMWLAWDLEGRLPGVGGLLADGALTSSKAKAVNEALQQLSSEDAAAAEAMILPDLPGQDLRPGRQARRPGGDHRRPGVGDPAPRGRGAELVPGDHVPRGVRRGGAVGSRHAHRPDPRRSRQRLRPRAGVQGLRRVS